MRDLYVVIVGCGRLGRMLANQLSGLGNSVVVIDEDESRFQKLSPEFSGFRIVGDAVEMDVLRRAKVAKADCLFATTNQDNVNLMVAQVAKAIFRVPHVLARVYNPAHTDVYSEFDIQTISPTKLSAEVFLDTLRLELGEAGT